MDISSIYTGKEGSGEMQRGQQVIKDLTKPLKGKHHHVFFDYFFTSEKLLCDLEKDNIYACGTAQKDHSGFPPSLKKAKLKNRSAFACTRVCVCTCMCLCVPANNCVCENVNTQISIHTLGRQIHFSIWCEDGDGQLCKCTLMPANVLWVCESCTKGIHQLSRLRQAPVLMIKTECCVYGCVRV